MIILDTNVISAPLQPHPDDRVRRWLDRQDVETLYLTTITVAEILYGLRAMIDGKRKNYLTRCFYEDIFALFDGRLLPFDYKSADEYARLMAQARKNGRPIGHNDAYIAAIALANAMRVATRDVSPFEVAGVEVITPWTASEPLV